MDITEISGHFPKSLHAQGTQGLRNWGPLTVILAFLLPQPIISDVYLPEGGVGALSRGKVLYG